MKPWNNTRLFALAKSKLDMNLKIVLRCIQACTPRSKQQAQLGSTQLDNGLLLRAQVVAGQVGSLKIGSCGVSLICAKIVGI